MKEKGDEREQHGAVNNIRVGVVDDGQDPPHGVHPGLRQVVTGQIVKIHE